MRGPQLSLPLNATVSLGRLGEFLVRHCASQKCDSPGRKSLAAKGEDVFRIGLLAGAMAVSMGLSAITPAMGCGRGPFIGYGPGHAGEFVKGVGQGAWDGVKGSASGVQRLVEGSYKLTTDGHDREQVWKPAIDHAKAVRNFAVNVVTDPSKAAGEIGDTAGRACDVLKSAYNRAAARGRGGEFIGRSFGQGAALFATTFVPGAAEADAAGAIVDFGRATSLAEKSGKLEDLGEAANITAFKKAGNEIASGDG